MIQRANMHSGTLTARPRYSRYSGNWKPRKMKMKMKTLTKAELEMRPMRRRRKYAFSSKSLMPRSMISVLMWKKW